MKDYFFCILASAVLSAICTALSYGALEKYVKYVCSLILAVAVIMPITALLGGKTDISLDISQNPKAVSCGEYAVGAVSKSAKEYIKGIVYDKFGITVREIRIEIYSEGGETTVGDIIVTLEKCDAARSGEVRDFLLTALGGVVEVNADERLD